MEEEGINAFAAGYSPRDAVIGVTRGVQQNSTGINYRALWLMNLATF